jgi:release factor glutamine methyltransferase
VSANPESTLAVLLRNARQCLADAGIADAAFDARLLVEHFSGTTRTDAITNPDRPIDPAAVTAVEAALARRIAGEPVHRILGFRDFYGLRLSLSEDTLEPRPDTETLVEAMLPFVHKTVVRKGSCAILDLGTGTGAIALALLSAEPRATATGVDISEGALATATRNAENLGLSGRFSALQSDWFEKVSGRFDAIVSNPPYIAESDIDALQKEVRDFDPRRALDGGTDGLDAYRTLAMDAAHYLEHDGVVGVEIGSTQKADVAGLFASARFDLVEAKQDLSENDRALVFQRR